MKLMQESPIPVFHPSYFIIHTFPLSSRGDLHQLNEVAIGQADGGPFRAVERFSIMLHEHQWCRQGELSKKLFDGATGHLLGFSINGD